MFALNKLPHTCSNERKNFGFADEREKGEKQKEKMMNKEKGNVKRKKEIGKAEC